MITFGLSSTFFHPWPFCEQGCTAAKDQVWHHKIIFHSSFAFLWFTSKPHWLRAALCVLLIPYLLNWRYLSCLSPLHFITLHLSSHVHFSYKVLIQHIWTFCTVSLVNSLIKGISAEKAGGVFAGSSMKELHLVALHLLSCDLAEILSMVLNDKRSEHFLRKYSLLCAFPLRCSSRSLLRNPEAFRYFIYSSCFGMT